MGGTDILSGSHTDITSLNEFTSSYLTDSASFDTRISNIGDHVNIGNLNEFTQSAESRLSQLESATGSYLTSETDNQTLTIVGDQLTISDGNTITIPTGSGGGSSDTGDIHFTGSTIYSDDDTDIILQATDDESNVRSKISLIPDDGSVKIEALTQEDSDTFTDSDWTTATHGDNGYGNGVVTITNALTIYNFLNDTLDSVNNYSFSINNGDRIPYGGWGYSSGTDTLSLSTDTFPTPTETVTSIEFFYQFTSEINVNQDDEEIQIYARGDMDIDIRSYEQDVRIEAAKDLRLEGGDDFILTQNDPTKPIILNVSGSEFEFNNDGTLKLPINGDIVDSDGNSVLSDSSTDITQLNQFTSSVQTEIDGLSSQTSSYLTELPTDLVSGSVLRTLDGTDVLSGSLVPGTGITIDSSSGDYVITAAGGAGDTSFDGNREVTNTLLGDLFTESFNAGTSGSIQDFLDAMFFPSYAPTATFTIQTSNLNTNLTADGTVIETISITDTVDDSPYVVTISGDDSGVFRAVATNADSSSWEIQSIDNLTAGTFTYDITVSDKNSASRTYSDRSVEILQANAGTLSTTGTLYIIESATTGPIYLGSNGRGGSQGGVGVSYSPNYGTQSARNFTSSNSLISINSSTGVLSVGDPIKGSGNLSGSTITTTIGWNDQYGNSGTSDITVNVTQNNAPDIQFSNSSRLNTNQAVNGGGTLVTISFSDTEGDSINHDSFQFTDTSGQLTATKSGNNYLVTADSNLSGSTSYTIGTTIEDVHGFRSNTESHTFTIVQSGNGTISGDTTIYIVESALNGDSFRDATGFGAGNTADVNVSYSPSAGGQSVQSFSSSNPSILINSSGNMTLGVDLSGSTTQSGDTIETLITFQDQYGNIGSGSVTANVFGNLAPSVSFVATSDYNTDNALANSNAGVITISDTETNSPYTVTLSGTNGDSFNVVPQNAASSSWQVQPKSSLSLGTYSIDITVTDNYGEVSTLSNKSIVVSAASDYGVVYAYMHNLGSTGNYSDAQYNGIYGIAGVNGDTPPEVTSFNSAITLLGTLSNNDVIGDEVISFQNSYNMIRLATINGDTSLDSALTNQGSITFSGTANIFLLYPSGSDMEVPTSIQESINGVAGGGVPYMNADNGGWGIEGAKLHSFTLSTPHLGYSEWFVLGRSGTNGIGSSFEYRIVNANGGSAPS